MFAAPVNQPTWVVVGALERARRSHVWMNRYEAMIKGLLDKLRKCAEKPSCSGSPAVSGQRNLNRRKQRLNEGFIRQTRYADPYPCTLRDMTALGGRLDLWSDVPARKLKGQVLLFVAADHAEVDAEIVWRRGNSLGLSFLGPMRPARS